MGKEIDYIIKYLNQNYEIKKRNGKCKIIFKTDNILKKEVNYLFLFYEIDRIFSSELSPKEIIDGWCGGFSYSKDKLFWETLSAKHYSNIRNFKSYLDYLPKFNEMFDFKMEPMLKKMKKRYPHHSSTFNLISDAIKKSDKVLKLRLDITK
jgi:hypothetical protein